MTTSDDKWLNDFRAVLESSPRELTAREIAGRIHAALAVAEVEQYATEKSRFRFALSGASPQEIEEIYGYLTPLERRVVEIVAA
jgi:hypothetical protein